MNDTIIAVLLKALVVFFAIKSSVIGNFTDRYYGRQKKRPVVETTTLPVLLKRSLAVAMHSEKIISSTKFGNIVSTHKPLVILTFNDNVYVKLSVTQDDPDVIININCSSKFS